MRPNEALRLLPGQIITFPELSDLNQDLSQLSSWSVSLYVDISQGLDLTLIPGILGFKEDNIQ